MAKIIHPYSDLAGGAWLRGNLHTHSRQSDGTREPQRVIDDYAARGYGFLMFSDHDFFTPEESFRKWNARGMVLIPGNEVGGDPHILHVDADRYMPPAPLRQEMLNNIAAAERETGRGFAIVNHPNWMSKFDHCTIEQMLEWTGYIGIEIYNGVIGRMDGSQYALDKWDLLLSAGRRVWGFANDDSHRDGDVELGWNVAYVKDRSRAGVVEALRKGRFYCSTGVTIRTIRVEGMKIILETENAFRIAAIQNVGKRIAVADASRIEVEVPGSARYVRFECWGQGEKMAWTQPFFIEQDPVAKVELPFLQEWRVSSLLEEGTLDEASPEQARKIKATPVLCNPVSGPIPGFVDVRAQVQNQPGVVYLATEIPSKEERRSVLKLGYDGPIRVWLNGVEIFHGPGTNPARPDELKLFVPLIRGGNALLIALDTNGGKAWGIFGRVE